MVIYSVYETEKEGFSMTDYKRLPEGLETETIISLNELKNNLFAAAGNAYMCHSDILESCLFDDIETVKEIISRKTEQAGKGGK